MKKSFRFLTAAILALLMICSSAGAALAEAPAYAYPDEQLYKAGEGETQVYTVQVSAGPNLGGAEYTRRQMLSAGFDCFLYETETGYRIMCGKFPDRSSAFRYRDLIRERAEREDAYVTDVKLPEEAIQQFREYCQKDPLVANALFNGWETPTGAFVDMTANEKETRTYYVVQYSCGENFEKAEKERDELISQGFDACVVKIPCLYLVISGRFENRNDARALRDEIRHTTDRWSACVMSLALPEAQS